MQLTEEQNTAIYQIKHYQPGCIRVNDQDYYSTIILSPKIVAPFNQQVFLAQMQLKPQIIILGANVPFTSFPAALLNNALSIELMSTSAACRTYTILSAEERHVLTILRP